VFYVNIIKKKKKIGYVHTYTFNVCNLSFVFF